MRPYRLLVIDDDEDISQLVCRVANEAGYETRAINDFTLASALLDSFKPNLLILDVIMPDMDGFEVMNHLHKSSCNARIVILSGESNYRDVAKRMGEGLSLDVAASIAKPFRLSELRQLLDTVKPTLPLSREDWTSQNEMQGERRMLVIEDDKDVADIVIRTGEEAGFNVHHASGLAALQHCQQHDPELVVLDLVMPDFDGLDILRALKDYGSQARIVILSGTPDGHRAIVKNLGTSIGLTIEANLSKPFRISELRAIFEGIRQSLEKRQALAHGQIA